MVNNKHQDFADRYYAWFGGRVHFGFLAMAAKKYGIGRCEEIISSMKHDGVVIAAEDRIKYFTSSLSGKKPSV